MQTPERPQGDNTYVLNAESAAEMGRLLLLNRTLTSVMGGFFPESLAVKKIRRVLDIGCGPGGWVLGVALKYPYIEVVGMDISRLMIAFARTQAAREGLANAHFENMNALEPLAFPDNSFDIVNIRAAVAYVPRQDWPRVLKECVRITRPGGTLIATESDHPGVSNSPAFERFSELSAQAIRQLGYGFSADNKSLGMTFMLGKLLRDAGCVNIQARSHILDFSYGMPLYGNQVQMILTAFESGRALGIKMGLASEEEMSCLYAALREEMQQETFRALMYWLTTWGEVPEKN